ncbi:MAG: hypothetical protein MJ158_03085 [Alphaproteobacteria bacterium]|nr:hypothetical protein [Alphaproteobacteria bacterium]
MDVWLMEMTAEMEAGDVFLRKNILIDINDTNQQIETKVSQTAIDLLNDYLSTPNKYIAQKQNGIATFTRKFTGDDEIIDLEKSELEIHNQIRALGCGRTKIKGVEVKILKTFYNNGKMNIITIQPAGKKSMDWKSFINGFHGQEIKIGY